MWDCFWNIGSSGQLRFTKETRNTDGDPVFGGKKQQEMSVDTVDNPPLLQAYCTTICFIALLTCALLNHRCSPAKLSMWSSEATTWRLQED